MHASIWTLAWPAMLEFGLQTIVQYADLFMVGGLGTEATAIVGITAQLHFLIKFPISSMSVGVLVNIAKAMGEKNSQEIRRTSMQTVFISLLIGMVGTIAAYAICPILPILLNMDGELKKGFLQYYMISYSTLILFTIGSMFAAVLRAVEDMKSPMFINGFVNILNIILNAIFIYPGESVRIGKLKVFLPGFGLGIIGSAIATAIAIGSGGIMMLLKVYYNPLATMRHEKLKPDLQLIKDLLKISIPAGLSSFVNGSGRLIFTSFVTGIGITAAAAHSIALTIEGFFYIPAVGVEKAVTVLAGTYLGEKNEKKLVDMTKAATILACGMMFVLGVLLLVFSGAFTVIFTKDSGVASLSAQMLRIVALTEPFLALSLVMEGAFQGLGNTKTPFWASTVSMWFFRVGICYILTVYLHLGLASVWICMIADNACRGYLLTRQFVRKKWKNQFQLVPEMKEPENLTQKSNEK